MRNRYVTRAREAIIEYLAEKCGQHLTVKDVYAYFEGQSQKIGMTTIYRQLDELVKEGLVKRCLVGDNGGTCFEYVGNSENNDSDSYHIKCDSCGKLMHLQCKEVSDLWNHLLEEHSFKIDSQKTVIYGYCGECLSKSGNHTADSGSYVDSTKNTAKTND